MRRPPTRVAWYYISHSIANCVSWRKHLFWGLSPFPCHSHHQKIDVCGGGFPINYHLPLLVAGDYTKHLRYIRFEFFGNQFVTQEFLTKRGVPLPSRSPRRLRRWFHNISPTPCGLQHIWSIPLLICKEPYVRLYIRYHQRQREWNHKNCLTDSGQNFCRENFVYLTCVVFFSHWVFARFDLSGSGVLLIFISHRMWHVETHVT